MRSVSRSTVGCCLLDRASEAHRLSGGGMTLQMKLSAITLDCTDPLALAAFYQQATGLEPHPKSDAEFAGLNVRTDSSSVFNGSTTTGPRTGPARPFPSSFTSASTSGTTWTRPRPGCWNWARENRNTSLMRPVGHGSSPTRPAISSASPEADCGLMRPDPGPCSYCWSSLTSATTQLTLSGPPEPLARAMSPRTRAPRSWRSPGGSLRPARRSTGRRSRAGTGPPAGRRAGACRAHRPAPPMLWPPPR